MSASSPSLVDTSPDGLKSLSEGSARRRLHAGRYRMAELLGEGGMSSVFGAYDITLERRVAIKMLRVDRGNPAGVLAREARVLAAVQHPNVVAVHALHEEDDPPFLVMEWIEGDSLEVVLSRGRPSLREALGLMRQIADGLDAIHRAGLIHGDVKPSNVIVGPDARVRIVDVGLVPRLERMEPGEVLGTPAYMPPERALGAITTRDLAPRSDVYSFAVLAFQLLAGRRPFEGEIGGAPAHTRGNAARRSPRTPRPFARVFEEPLARALSGPPVLRHASAGLLVDALERAALAVDARGQTLRLLVVDDEVDTRSLYCAGLASRLRGAVVESVGDGQAALESIRRETPSAAIFDLAMPRFSGVDLLRAAFAVAPALQVIVCTGVGSGTEWRAARELGVRNFFVKPVQLDDLVRVVREVADGRRPDPARHSTSGRPPPR